MGTNDKIQIFEDKKIRTAWNEETEEWYFSVVDVVGGCKISADWPGLLRRNVEKILDGTKCIFFNGAQGDVTHVNVPPCAATIWPLYVMRAKERIEAHELATCGAFSLWQRMTSRFCTHGPFTPYFPSSMLQTKKTQVYISEELVAPFECWEKIGY